ncbi:hypothetical protein A2797_00450 [candidate division WWE3 bacterium RIFCSPHIGHO2_01_FULL_48_15]|uniref:Adenylate kinase n=1 Tax=candidate division WWE3 bacterium RIFCSPHIGHO2_01_FULL_48_15 TaxID=1802619 RepID=A0A1F4V9W6_UNCKA|nr:MAG: hypothetical protein A2797_00450 [candidate division WWE3 bacterium RIFCSPHIGHO2_01_FULL_48_15]
MRIAIIGATGSGKTTQSQLLARHLSLPIISVGEMLRDLAKKSEPQSKEVQAALSKGKLVSPKLALQLLRQRLLEVDAEKGFILDGMPRTVIEAQQMQKLFSLRHVFHLEADLKVAQKRLLERGREDDTEELISKRFGVYQKEIEPILKFYRQLGILVEIDASATTSEINKKIVSNLS